MEHLHTAEYKHTRIPNDIYELQCADYDIEIAETEDRAYEQPERIDAMYRQLAEAGEVYANRIKFQRPLSLAAATLYDKAAQTPAAAVATPLRASRKRIERIREDAREALLFDETKMPWHLQRGKALALQTITDAHDLKSVEGSDGRYDTMSGRLPQSLRDFQFGFNADWMRTLTLRDAMIAAGQKFRGKSEESATAFADKELEKLDTFLHAPVTDDFKEIVAYCHDSLGIRARKEIVREAAQKQFAWYKDHRPTKRDATFLSVGCGTAQSILEVAQDAREQGYQPNIILFDQDPVALAAAMTLAEQMELSEHVELHCGQLFNARGESELAQVLGGRQVDIAEDSGLREYLKPGVYKNLTNAIWNHLRDDGLMITGNMNKGRIQAEFLHGLMGWSPQVQMRTPQEGFRLHEQSGVPRGQTIARVTQDTVYSVFMSSKNTSALRNQSHTL